MEDKYIYKVSHPKHGELKVEATSRYWAIVAAAREWGVSWTTIARECEVTRLEKVQPKKTRKEKKANGKADKKRPRNH